MVSSVVAQGKWNRENNITLIAVTIFQPFEIRSVPVSASVPSSDN